MKLFVALIACVLLFSGVKAQDDDDHALVAANCFIDNLNYKSLICDKFTLVKILSSVEEGTDDPSGDVTQVNQTILIDLAGHKTKVEISMLYNEEFDSCDYDDEDYTFFNVSGLAHQLAKLTPLDDSDEKPLKFDAMIQSLVAQLNRKSNTTYKFQSLYHLRLRENRYNSKFNWYDLKVFLLNGSASVPFYMSAEAYFPCGEYKLGSSNPLGTLQCSVKNNRPAHVVDSNAMYALVANWTLAYLNEHNATATSPLVWDATAKKRFEGFSIKNNVQLNGNIVEVVLHTSRAKVPEYHFVSVFSDPKNSCFEFVKEQGWTKSKWD